MVCFHLLFSIANDFKYKISGIGTFQAPQMLSSRVSFGSLSLTAQRWPMNASDIAIVIWDGNYSFTFLSYSVKKS